MAAPAAAKILIVDDDSRNLMVLEALLADLGPDLVSARSGEEALRKLLHDDYVVILLDVQMPGIDGFETARLIRQRDRHESTPLIFLTATSVDIEQVMHGYAVGAVDFMLKPLEPIILKSKVQVFVDLHRKTEQVRAQAEQLRVFEQRAHAQELALEKARKAEELARTNEQLATMARAMTAFLSERSWPAAAKLLLAGALELTHSRAGFLATGADEASATVWSVHGFPGLGDPKRAAALTALMSEPAPLIRDAPDSEPKLAPLIDGLAGVRNFMSIPIAGPDGPTGVFVVAVRDDSYEDDARATVTALARTAGVLYEAHSRTHSERQLSEQLRQSQKMEAIGALAGGIAHDFNNLLTVIQGYVSFLLHGLKPGDPQRENAQAIQEASTQAAWLTRQLLAFSRKQVLQPRVLDVNVLATATEKMLRRVIGEHIQLVTQVAREPAQVKADPAQLEQVLMNLAVNARDAMPDGGRLSIKVALPVVREGAEVPPGDYVMLEVSDTGTGMDEKTRQRIFEPFFTTKEAGKGTGLGLATVYGIVQQSGGHVAVHSVLGRGTSFRIWLPRAHEDVEPLVAAPISRPGVTIPNTEVILLVEDERPVRMLTRRVLEQAGYRVLEADSGERALKICQEHDGPIQLLLTDMVMPGMNGRELADRASECRPEMVVLFMSGYMDEMLGSITAEERETRFIEKPFSPDAMVKKVRGVLDASPSGSKHALAVGHDPAFDGAGRHG